MGPDGAPLRSQRALTRQVLGYGLLIMLDDQTSTAVTEILFIVPAIGIGPLFQLPLLALQAAMPIKFMCAARL